MVHRLVAAVAFATHMVFVAFTVVGGFLAWLVAPWLLLPHLAAAAWGGRMASTRAICPLSRLENWGREGAGRPRLDERGFISRYFEGRIYPRGRGRRIQLFIGGLIVSSWALIVARCAVLSAADPVATWPPRRRNGPVCDGLAFLRPSPPSARCGQGNDVPDPLCVP